MIIHTRVSNVAPVRIMAPTADRLIAVTLLNLGPGPAEIVKGNKGLVGTGFPLIPGAELELECAGSEELWAVSSSTTPVTIVGTRMVIERASVEWSYKGPVDDMTIARLPFYEAQAKLRGAPLPKARLVTCEWHGPLPPRGDPERTSFAIVNDQGPLTYLVGERIMLTFANKTVFAYVHKTGVLDDQISVTRRVFMALAPLSKTTINAELQVVV